MYNFFFDIKGPIIYFFFSFIGTKSNKGKAREWYSKIKTEGLLNS